MKTIITNIKGKEKLNICLLADIHFSKDYNIKIFDKIIKNVSEHKPDYICIAGDIIDEQKIENIDKIKYLYSFIDRLTKLSKVIIVLGNHDISDNRMYHYPKKLIKELKKLDLILLENNIYEDKKIRFIGYLEDYNITIDENNKIEESIKSLNKLIKDIDNKKMNILLAHNPIYISKEKVYNNVTNFDKINLVLSGHTHNGLLPNFIKTNQLLISPSKNFFFKETGRSHYKLKKADIVVTGGVIKLSALAGILHIFNFLFSKNIDYVKVDEEDGTTITTKKEIKC